MSRVLTGLTFPDRIARNLDVDESWSTLLISTASGYEQALGRMSVPQIVMSLTVSIDGSEMLSTLQSFLKVTRGRLYGFRVRDWSDFIAGYEGYFAGATDTPVVIGTGNASQAAFQLSKAYTSGGNTYVRKITRPRDDATCPLKVYLDSTLQTSGYTVNWETGVITFASAPGSGVLVKASFVFDIPARFDSDSNGLNLTALSLGVTKRLTIRSLIE